MHQTLDPKAAIAGLDIGTTTSIRDTGAAKLTVLHRETVETMPQGGRQEIRVLHARLDPGDRTPYHSHRFPVTVHILQGTFTLELDDRPPVVLPSGSTFVEPAHIRMTGRNFGDEPTTMVIFYASDPETPFADPVSEEANPPEPPSSRG